MIDDCSCNGQLLPCPNAQQVHLQYPKRKTVTNNVQNHSNFYFWSFKGSVFNLLKEKIWSYLCVTSFELLNNFHTNWDGCCMIESHCHLVYFGFYKLWGGAAFHLHTSWRSSWHSLRFVYLMIKRTGQANKNAIPCNLGSNNNEFIL